MAAEPGQGPDPELEELLDSALDDFEKARPAAPPQPPAPTSGAQPSPSAAAKVLGIPDLGVAGPWGAGVTVPLSPGLPLRLAGEVLPGALRGGAGGAGGGRVRAGHAGAGAGGAPLGGAVPEALGSSRQSGRRRSVAAGIHLLPEGDAERLGQERHRPAELFGLGRGAGEGAGGAGAGGGRRRRRPARHAQHHAEPALQGRALPLAQGDHREVPGVAAAARAGAAGGAVRAVPGAARRHGPHLPAAGGREAGRGRGGAAGALRDPPRPHAAAAGPGPPPQGAGGGVAPRPEPGAGGGGGRRAVPPHVAPAAGRGARGPPLVTR